VSLFQCIYFLSNTVKLICHVYWTIFMSIKYVQLFFPLPSLFDSQLHSLDFSSGACTLLCIFTPRADGGNGLHLWRIAVNGMNKQSWRLKRGDPPASWLDRGPTTPYNKIPACYKMLQGPQAPSCEHGNDPLGFISTLGQDISYL